jgi:sucrose-6-phosphatase
MSIRRLLLCTDLDRTLLPNGQQPESPEARALFAQLVRQKAVSLVYVSGRHLELVDDAIAEYGIPVPDFAITDVGTRIYAREGDDWQAIDDWDTEIARDWGDFDHARLSALFEDVDLLRLQEASKQNSHKLSFYFPPETDLGELESKLVQQVSGHHVLATFVLSVDEVENTGLCDVVPASATKLHAIEFLRERLGFAIEDTLFAGDSGNDLGVLASHIPSVLVANATDDVRNAALERAKTAGHEDALYCASGDFLGLNGNYSAGILEGVEHFHPERMVVIVRRPAR